MRTLNHVDPTTAAILGGIGGLMLGALALVAVRLSDRARSAGVVLAPAPPLPPGVGEVLSVLDSSGVVVDESDRVVNHSPAAVATGLVRGTELVHPELLEMARLTRRDGVIREAELSVRRRIGQGQMVAMARVAPLGTHHVLLLVEDRTRAHRVEQVRRDFLENISHELKTPVGGIALLAEAVLDAQDDPELVARFAARISVEADRLTRLVKEIVELSRLQSADSVKEPVRVDLGACAHHAVDRSKLLADQRAIDLVCHVEPDCMVWSDAELITTAVANLVVNAVAYSEPSTRVGISVRHGDPGLVTVSVTDQGIGIAAAEQERIFERFYRVDAARSRETGGTGLGLAIVKHIADNHGGTVSVWSEPGRGSTFTLTFPDAASWAPAGRSTDPGRHAEQVERAEHVERADSGDGQPRDVEAPAGDPARATP